MWVPIRLVALCAGLLVMLALGAGVALGQEADSRVTQEIFADFAFDHSIDGSYSADDPIITDADG